MITIFRLSSSRLLPTIFIFVLSPSLPHSSPFSVCETMNLEVVAASQLLGLQQGSTLNHNVAHDDLDCSVSTSDVLEHLDDCSDAQFIEELNADAVDSLSSQLTAAESSSLATVTTTAKRIAPFFSPGHESKKFKTGLFLSPEAQKRLMNEPIPRDDLIDAGDGYGEQCSEMNSTQPNATIPTMKNSLIPSSSTNESSGEPLVGIDSWQMDVLHRMMEKLSPEPKRVLQEIVGRAIDRHNEGDVKYKHLPGSIFEDAMTHMDTDLFLETYIAVRNDMNHHPSDSVPLLKSKKKLSASRRTEISDIQLAMGYAFTLGMKHGQSPLLNELTSMEDLLREAREKVSNLGTSQRSDVWAQIVEFAQSSSNH